VCDNWLRNGATLDQVVANLGKANFDPEFFKKFEKQVQSHFEIAKS
jgi:mannitol-1-phosphate/altronate dehydrogenase